MNMTILFVDDDDSDVQVMIHRLQADGLRFEACRVSDETSLRAALVDHAWDVALVDYRIPGFSGLEAMKIIGEEAPETPTITVSGTIDEETAVATLTAGAVDYVQKGNLTRLAPAVERAIAGTATRTALRRRSQEARRTRFVLDHSSFPVSMIAKDGTIVYANQSAVALSGYAADKFVGAKLWECDVNQSPTQWASLWAIVREQGTAQTERVAVTASGEERVLANTMNYVQDEGPPTIVTYTRDVTEERRAVAALRESEERFEAFGRHLPGYIYMLDESRRYVFANHSLADEDDIPPEEWIGKTPADLWPPQEAAIEMDAVARALKGEVIDTVLTWKSPSKVEHLHSLFFPIRREGGPPLVGGLSIDVSDLVAAEERLRQTAGELRDTAERLRLSLDGTMIAMGQIVETRDPYTAGHERRVAELAVAIARELGLDGDLVEGLGIAASIHDIGKIAVPAEILTKPGRLNEAEFGLIRQHSRAGYDILSGIAFEHPVAEAVLQHHERLDGSGYPNGLKEPEITLQARIIAVADVVEAMSSHRPYRPALGIEAALEEVEDGAGVRYDADTVRACVRVIREAGFTFSG